MNDRTDTLSCMQPQRSTAEYRALDAAHHIHPFSDMDALNRAGSRVIVRGEGVYLWDSDGNRIIDGMAGLWCVNVGYGRRELADAAYGQMQQLPFYNTFFNFTVAWEVLHERFASGVIDIATTQRTPNRINVLLPGNR